MKKFLEIYGELLFSNNTFIGDEKIIYKIEKWKKNAGLKKITTHLTKKIAELISK